MPSFSDLLSVHREMDNTFRQHQYALLHFDFDRAAQVLGSYRERLFEHMRFEEDVLFPIYEERATIDPTGGRDLLQMEHDKMRGWVELFVKETGELKSEGDPDGKVLDLLEREWFYLKLCSHHDTREKRFLFPSLDAVTTPQERAELLLLHGS